MIICLFSKFFTYLAAHKAKQTKSRWTIFYAASVDLSTTTGDQSGTLHLERSELHILCLFFCNDLQSHDSILCKIFVCIAARHYLRSVSKVVSRTFQKLIYWLTFNAFPSECWEGTWQHRYKAKETFGCLVHVMR